MNTVNKQIISHVIPIIILLMAVYSVVPYLRPGVPMASLLNNTMLWWCISGLILLVFFISKYYFFDKRNADNMIIIWLYLLWNAVCIVRGLFEIETYWDLKGLITNALALLLPIIIFSSTNKIIVQSLLAFYVKYALPLFLIFGLITRTDAFGFYLIPISLLIFFLPVFTKRQKYIVLFVTAILIIADPAARSNVIKFSIPFFILLFYYFRNKIPSNIIETFRLGLLILPIILLVLGVTSVFNVFKISEYIKGDVTAIGLDNEGNRVDMNVIEDTRTFLYIEVLESAVNNNYWFLGRTPARGNDSELFGMTEQAELIGKDERLANEIGLANIFTWTGVVGVIFYFLIFYRASYLAVNKSRNIYVKMLGIYVAFRWLFSWIEDVNNFSLNYFMLMIMLGLCFSYSFRNMSDKEIIIWARGIFDVRYFRFQQYLLTKGNNEESKYGSLADLPQQEK